jgi:4-amino-4-deoxy-L-arabinose transferase-like glycosyltransferase
MEPVNNPDEFAAAPKVKRNLYLQILLLFAITGIALYLTKPQEWKIRWNDETLYFTVAKNIFLEHDFNSHHYLSESLLRKGYPTKDTHPPGYPLMISLSFLLFGVHEFSPYLLNYLLTFSTVLLLLFLGRHFRHPWAGFLASCLYLIHPLTLPHSQSIMSEVSAAFTVTLFFFLLVVLREGIGKGISLAIVASLATLIKPFLLVLLPAGIIYLWWTPKSENRSTCYAYGVASVVLLAVFVFPLSSHREYYPSPINDLFLQSGLAAKIAYALNNFKRNLGQITHFSIKSGEGGFVTLTLLMIGISGLHLLLSRRAEGSKNTSSVWRLPWLFVAWLTAFILTTMAVLFIYEFYGYRGSRALYCFVPMLGFFFSLALAKPRFKLSPLIFGISSLALFLYYWQLTWPVLEYSKKRQTNFIYSDYQRLDTVLSRYGLTPKTVLAKGNLLLPVRRYPTKAIWSEPRNLTEFAQIENKLPPDVLETREDSPLFQDNLRLFGSTNYLGPNYQLFYSENHYFYYKRVSE